MGKYHAQRPTPPRAAPPIPAPSPTPAASSTTRHSVLRIVGLFVLTAFIGITTWLLYRFNFVPHRQYSNADFGIVTYQSLRDADDDGVDDQTDILESARAYLATKPKYKSAYYAGGYPDDGYGVCTDVIAFALRGAGYDLRELVDADMKQAPEAYNIEIPDANIDFRRVANLAVFFQRHAESLTTDRSKIAEWQGGDIVVFPTHIALVSDHRNRRGVPFLIHHYSPAQATYEEDILENYPQPEIIGHYRVN